MVSIYSEDPEMLSVISMTILALWTIENDKNEMRVEKLELKIRVEKL